MVRPVQHATDGTNEQEAHVKRSEQAEWDRMNRENADAARNGNGRPVVTSGNTGRGNSGKKQ